LLKNLTKFGTRSGSGILSTTDNIFYKMLSYRRETALQGAL